MKKEVYFGRRAVRELKQFPKEAQREFDVARRVLARDGKLEPPLGDKIRGVKGLFEVRIKLKGQWRGLYAYLSGNEIIILRCFHKKVQKTPKKEIKTALSRLNQYL